MIRHLAFCVRWTICCLLLLAGAAATHAQTTSLDTGWSFLPDAEGKLTANNPNSSNNWRDVRVGLSWNAQFADLRDYMGVAWYRKTIDAPDLSNGRHAILRFGAVDYLTEVFINGKSVGLHEGGYTPFSFDITDNLRPGSNVILVRVIDPPMDQAENRARFPEMMYNEIPHGKQNWYVQTGGIWQGVWLDVKPKDYITLVHVTPKPDGSVSVQVSSNASLGPPPPMAAHRTNSSMPIRTQSILDRISVRVLDPAGNAYPLKLTGGGGFVKDDYVFFQGKIPHPQLWDISKPALYKFEVALGDDHATGQFGFRTFEARDGKFYLNGQPFYMIAALDQDFYPDTIYTAPSKEYVRQQMIKAKQLGLNVLRCHIKVCEPAYLEAADEVGMLVWYEIPSWNDAHHFAQKAAERGDKIFQDMVARDWNHPSIIIQSVINEGWGADLPHDDASRKWVRAAFDRAKQTTAPLGRVIVDNSACCDNFHLKTDIVDNHRYNSIPDEYPEFDKWVADFATRPAWNFSTHGDAEQSGREPLVLSEFGNWGLPKLPKDLPWWFGRGFGDNEFTPPAGLFERFKEFKFGSIFRDYDALAEATEWHQFISLKHEIEQIRRHESIQGYVITEFTDINWEANGLLSMWREPKVYASELAKVQQPDVVFGRLPKYNFTSGETVAVDTSFSHFTPETTAEAVTLKWSTSWGERGKLEKKLTTGPASVESLGNISFSLPSVDSPRAVKISLSVLSSGGQKLAENSVDLFLYPTSRHTTNTSLYFHDPANTQVALKNTLASAGYELITDETKLSPKTLAISTVLDEAISRHLRNGGRAVIIAGSKEALPASSPFKITPRAGSVLDGNWVTNFNWVNTDKSSPYSAVPFGNILGFESAKVVPRFLIQGVPGANYDDVFSGIFFGWLNNNSALTVQMRSGEGKLLLTTFRFDEYGTDPYATHLLNSMIAYTNTGNFAPKLEYPSNLNNVK